MPRLTTISPRVEPYGQGNVIRKKVTFAAAATVVDFGRLPAYASVVGGGVHVLTADNDSGTCTINVGFRGGSSTDDPDAYATLLDLKTIGFKALDELATTTNIMQTQPAILTCTRVPQNANATAGVYYVSVHYSTGASDGSS